MAEATPVQIRDLAQKNIIYVLRHPGIEPGPHRWQRRILTTELMARNYICELNTVRAPRIELGTYCV